MSLSKKHKKEYVFHLVILSASLVLLICNGYDILINKTNNYMGLISNVLVALSMILLIRSNKKKMR
jgi:uncharacterized membrane protein YkvI